ncbi:terminase small subunit [Bacillus phage Carmen17]|uniref:Terminase small subunit n=1 Tax=Bacillus phage Carmen17 TaxID=2072797 RepID=A0A2I7QIK7_9CAUD|nr:terminase small subunit [Bacillus phage Carmen17]AUR81226.1 terminase small subunit [Bacillus phage Carmen17]
MSFAINWAAMKDEWETTDITLVDLARKHRVKHGTVKSRKAREKWEKLEGAALKPNEPKVVVNVEEGLNGDDRVIIKPEIVVTPRQKQPSRRNYARTAVNSPWLAYMPDDVVELMRKMEQADPLDILYDQIRLQWSMIVRGQEIMYVSDQTDIDKFKSSLSDTGLSYEIHTSWDKYGKFMSAMSTAQKELRFLIQQFMDIAPVEDERRARIKAIEATTELTEQRIKALKGNTKDTTMLNVLIGAMEGVQK